MNPALSGGALGKLSFSLSIHAREIETYSSGIFFNWAKAILRIFCC